MSLASSSNATVHRVDFSSWQGLLDLWQSDRKAVRKTQETYLRIAHQFHNSCGKKVSEVTKKDVIDFKNELIDVQKKTNPNVREILSKLRSLLGVAVENEILEFNPASDVKVTVKKGENKRLPFSHEDLLNVFSNTIFKSGSRPIQGRGEAAFFIPILMLLHGMRPREIAQMRIKDVQSHTIFDHEGNKSSWPFLHITRDIRDGLTLKNTESERFVPIHPAVIQLGFIDYVQRLRATNIYWLFPELKADKFGNKAAKWSEWFNHCLRTEHGISERRKVLYSFRHTFKDLARACSMPDELQRAIMGHGGRGVADTYGSGFGLYKLLEAIRMVRVPGVSIQGVPLQSS
jgi:integrase